MDISNIIKEIAEKHVALIEHMLKELPEGSILCVHNSEFTIPAVGEDINKFVSRTVCHVINHPDECDSRVVRTQYLSSFGVKNDG